MTATRRNKVLGTALIAVAGLGVSAASAAPSFAASTGTGTAKGSTPASSPANISPRAFHVTGQAFELRVARQFRQVFTPGDPHLRLSGGATLVNGGFRLPGGSGTFDPVKGDLTENLQGTLTYTTNQGPQTLTIQVKNFKFEATTSPARAELAGDIRITGGPQPISETGLDLLDLQLSKRDFSHRGNSIEAKNVPGLLSNQAAQIAAQFPSGILPPGGYQPQMFIGDASFAFRLAEPYQRA